MSLAAERPTITFLDGPDAPQWGPTTAPTTASTGKTAAEFVSVGEGAPRWVGARSSRTVTDSTI
jgi:hypothetical protein